MKASFVGDISLNDNYIIYYEKGIDPFKSIEEILFDNDYLIGNLECVAVGEFGENVLKKPRLKTTIGTLDYLIRLKVNTVCLAQNHIYDHLEDGFLKTIKFLDRNNICYLGASLNDFSFRKPIILEHDKVRIGLLNYVTLDTNPNMPPDAPVKLNIFELHVAIEDIKGLEKEVDHIVILLHWGGKVEGGLYPDYHQPKIARRLIDEGADLIIGHHSHTFQPYEIYKGKYIFYSLGNFCFSDYEFEGKKVHMPKRRNVTGIVQVNFSKSNYYIDLTFYRNLGIKFKLDRNYIKKLKFRNFLFKYFVQYKPFWNLYYLNKKSILPICLFLIRNDIPFTEKTSRIFKSILKKIT